VKNHENADISDTSIRNISVSSSFEVKNRITP